MHSFYKKDPAIVRAEKELAELSTALDLKKTIFEKMQDDPEFNRFETGEEAEDVLEEKFLERAAEACEGAYNLGAPEYTQELFIAGVPYTYTIEIEYNRHDKTYYYVDGHTSTMIRTPPKPITQEEFEVLSDMIEPGTSRFEVLLAEFKELKGW